MNGPVGARFGLVAIAALDVRRRPGHRSEMGSQLLMGETVRLVERGPGDRWLRVRHLGDGYRGWVRSWGLVGVSARGLADWRRRARGRVVLPWVEVRTGRGRGGLVSPLFWGSRVIAGRARGGFRPVELPDGSRGWAPARGVAAGPGAAASLAARVRDLTGVPYLWGGRTPAGIDCSGLVQLLLAERGVALPRDAGEQERSCRPLPAGGAPRPGDLAFFGPRGAPAAHVGVMLSGDAFVHSRGRVRVNSIDPSNPLYDSVLCEQFRSVRRPGRTPRRGR